MSTTVKSLREQKVAGLPDCPECLGGNLAWLLGQAHYALLSEVNAAFAPLGISSRGYHVLAAALTGEHTQSERRPSETDRRARVIVVTEAGERKVTEGREVIKAIQAGVLETLPARQRAIFLDSLATLVRERLAEPVECSPPLRRREPR